MSINKIQINNKTQNNFYKKNYFNPKNYSYKFLSDGKNKLNRDNLGILTNKYYMGNNYYKKNSFSSREIQNNNETNLFGKTPRNTNLFSKIKKLLSDFQKENAEKNRLYNYKKGNKKSKNKNKANNSSNKIQKLSSLLAPHKKVYYTMPKIKNQMQLNHYLINDFKEVDSEQAYVTRSLKYQKMKEDFDELLFISQIKEAEKNGVTENIMNDNEKNENNIFGFHNNDNNKEDNKSNNFQNNNKNNENNAINAKNRDEKKKNSVFNKNIYDMSLRRLYTENNIFNKKNDINKENNNINNNINSKVFEQININNNPSNPSITSRTKISENENSLLENNDINKLNKSVGIRFLMDKRIKTNPLTNNTINLTNNNENLINNNNINNNINTVKKDELKQSKKKRGKKESLTIDKYSFSNKIYKNQRIEYNKYKKNQQEMRSTNFSKQIALLFKEKERYGINDDINETKGHPKLDHKKLIYQMQLRDTFINSFNTMRLLEEGDQDLDLDNLNKIKQYIKDYENEMTRVMKNSDNFNCIKKHFNLRTLGKFHSSRGIYM